MKNGEILVIVHPGSACGSADFNLGDDAPGARDALVREILAWQGHVMVVDGELSSELDIYPQVGTAIENAIKAAAAGGYRSCRTVACDFTIENWPRHAAARFSEQWPGRDNDVVLTGAWVEEGGNGCVPALLAALGAQQSLRIAEGALTLS